MLSNYYQTTYSAIRAILPDVWIIIMVRQPFSLQKVCCDRMSWLVNVHTRGKCY